MTEPPVDYTELNMSNFDDDQVSQLNEWAIWANAEIKTLRAELASHLEIILQCEGSLSTALRPGWWDSMCNSCAVEAGDRLVELGLYERHAGGVGRRQFYRKKI